MSRAITLHIGSWFSYDGELVEIMELSGSAVTVRNAGQSWRSVGLNIFVSMARPDGEALPVPALVTRLAALTETDRSNIAARAEHIRELLTGFRSGSCSAAREDEPRGEYLPSLGMRAKEAVKACELGVSARTLRRWVSAYRADGELGLIDERMVTGRGSTLDARWESACRQILAEQIHSSTPTAGALLRLIDGRLDELHGPDMVRRPSAATAYRHLARLTKGTNAVTGSAKGRRSIADRPQGVYGRLRATRPGEFVILDTQDLDVFAMEPVTCRWLPVQLTVAQDLFTRCIIGLKVTPVSTKAVDVARVLHQAVLPQTLPEQWPESASWPYHGLPEQLVFTEAQHVPEAPVFAPETLVIDHGKAFLSAHVISVCTRLGISIQPAQAHKPTDKPTVERFFRTLRQGLIQYLPAYKGPDIYSRGTRVEDQAFYYLHELEELIREWIAAVYHPGKHEGLCVPEWPQTSLSPNDMYQIGVARAGRMRIPASADLAFDFLATAIRTIQHYGVEIRGLIYNGLGLEGYRNARSPYLGELAGRWPIRFNPDDVRYAWFQDPGDNTWHRLDWEHAPALGGPFSLEAALYARQLARQDGRFPDQVTALRELLARWEQGIVQGRRERRIAARTAGMRGGDNDVGNVPGVAAAAPGTPGSPGGVFIDTGMEYPTGDDDDDEMLAATSDFYDDAFEVLP